MTPTCPQRKRGKGGTHTTKEGAFTTTMGVHETEPSTSVKGEQTRLSTSCPKKQEAHLSMKEEA